MYASDGRWNHKACLDVERFTNGGKPDLTPKSLDSMPCLQYRLPILYHSLESLMASETELKKNYEAFQRKLLELLPLHAGKFVLMHDGEIVEMFDTARDAYVSGNKLYPDQEFSIQEVANAPVNLGFLSHALS